MIYVEGEPVPITRLEEGRVESMTREEFVAAQLALAKEVKTEYEEESQDVSHEIPNLTEDQTSTPAVETQATSVQEPVAPSTEAESREKPLGTVEEATGASEGSQRSARVSEWLKVTKEERRAHATKDATARSEYAKHQGILMLPKPLMACRKVLLAQKKGF